MFEIFSFISKKWSESKLIVALEKNNLRDIKYIHENDTSVFHEFWYLAINYSISNTNCDIDVFSYLYHNNDRDFSNKHVLNSIVVNDRLDIMTYIYENGFYDNECMLEAFNNSVHSNKIDMFKYLYTNWCTNETYAEHAFQLAIEESNMAVVKYLCEDGINIHFGDDTPWSVAVNSKNLSIMKYLVENGVDVNSRNNYAITRPSLVLDDNLEILKFLHENGADIHCQDNFLLVTAIEKNNYTAIKYLCENGADVNARDGKLLKFATRWYGRPTIECLCEHGAKIELCDIKNAAAYGNFQVVEYFGDNYVDVAGYEFDVPRYHIHIIKYLREKGASVNGSYY